MSKIKTLVPEDTNEFDDIDWSIMDQVHEDPSDTDAVEELESFDEQFHKSILEWELSKFTDEEISAEYFNRFPF